MPTARCILEHLSLGEPLEVSSECELAARLLGKSSCDRRPLRWNCAKKKSAKTKATQPEQVSLLGDD
ncbi:hypothetical protein [Enhygromyxa salina]|nr:hypothetical protein [Enhygromyxa salina]